MIFVILVVSQGRGEKNSQRGRYERNSFDFFRNDIFGGGDPKLSKSGNGLDVRLRQCDPTSIFPRSLLGPPFQLRALGTTSASIQWNVVLLSHPGCRRRFVHSFKPFSSARRACLFLLQLRVVAVFPGVENRFSRSVVSFWVRFGRQQRGELKGVLDDFSVGVIDSCSLVCSSALLAQVQILSCFELEMHEGKCVQAIRLYQPPVVRIIRLLLLLCPFVLILDWLFAGAIALLSLWSVVGYADCGCLLSRSYAYTAGHALLLFLL